MKVTSANANRGHRRTLLYGMVFFALFNLFCAVSPTFMGTVIAKTLEGICAAFTIPPAQVHIILHFSDPERKAKALGIRAAAGSSNFIIGMILGGFCTACWRWIFGISLIILGTVILFAHVVLPRVPPHPPRAATPPVGSENTSNRSQSPENSLVPSIRERLIQSNALGKG